MNAEQILETSLANLKQEIKSWKPAVLTDKGTSSPTMTAKIRIIADALGVSEKTVWNWMNSPADHAIPLRKVFDLCQLLGIGPYSLFPGCSRIETIHRISDPIEAERSLLEIEKGIQDGGMRRVVFPLWYSMLFRERLTEIYATKGFHNRFLPLSEEDGATGPVLFGEAERKNLYFSLREERISLFESGRYVLRLVFMRDELERFLNGDRLFKRCKPEERIAQMENVLRILGMRRPNQQPLLEMRMTKSYFRMQYGISMQSDGTEALVLHTNSGYLKVVDTGAKEFLKKEFDTIWDSATYQGLRTAEEWNAFLGILISEVQKRSEEEARGGTFGKIDLRAILAQPPSSSQSDSCPADSR
jgi:predicted DNA-binding transcriptional regulator AlpA